MGEGSARDPNNLYYCVERRKDETGRGHKDAAEVFEEASAGKSEVGDMTYSIRVCTATDTHPYECDGKGHCHHCDRRTIKNFHYVSKCAFCKQDAADRKEARRE